MTPNTAINLPNNGSLRCFLGIAIALAFVSTGCNNKGLYLVEGKVTVAGEPLTQGRIQFLPESGRRASGRIQGDGSYQLTTFDPGDGAKLGEYTVIVEAVQTETQGERPKSLLEEATVGSSYQVKNQSLVNPKYNLKSTSPLTATVESRRNQIDFDLEE